MKDGIYRVDFKAGDSGYGIAMIRHGEIRGIDQNFVYSGDFKTSGGHINVHLHPFNI
jgi:hypothetical protein